MAKQNKENYWREPYPLSLAELTVKCDKAIDKIHEILSNTNCAVLDNFYSVNNSNQHIERQVSVFEAQGYYPNAKLSPIVKTNNELKGLYVFAETPPDKTISPCYVGISGTIFRRLKQHGWYKLHNEATLAYLKASSKTEYKGERKDLEYPKIEEQQKIIRQYKVAIIPEVNDYDLYFMEVYIAGKLKTLWNSFKTH